jgi:TonB family protein
MLKGESRPSWAGRINRDLMGNNGPGKSSGGGIGEGTSVGPGRAGNTGGGGGGIGPGIKPPAHSPAPTPATDYNRTFSPKEVTTKARILSKPEPQYTEKARINGVTGTVIVRAVLGSDATVRGIRVVSALPYGLTSGAVRAAGKMRFMPAVKDGHQVSQYIQIEYNFNLY